MKLRDSAALDAYERGPVLVDGAPVGGIIQRVQRLPAVPVPAFVASSRCWMRAVFSAADGCSPTAASAEAPRPSSGTASAAPAASFVVPHPHRVLSVVVSTVRPKFVFVPASSLSRSRVALGIARRYRRQTCGLPSPKIAVVETLGPYRLHESLRVGSSRVEANSQGERQIRRMRGARPCRPSSSSSGLAKVAETHGGFTPDS